MCYIKEENYIHRHIEELVYDEKNGLIIYFSDGSHTFINESIIQDIIKSSEYFCRFDKEE